MKDIIKKICAYTLAACSLFAIACGNDEESSSGGSSSGGGDVIDQPTQESIASTDILLVENGGTQYTVVMPKNATAAEEYAVEVLCEQFERATGILLSVSADNGQALDQNKKIISVGRTSILANSGLSVTQEELKRDGYKLKRYGKTVVLCGATDSGTLYSVGDFLHYQFNYEAYAADEIYIEKTNTSYLKDYNVVEIPDFWSRDTDGYVQKYPDHAASLRLRTLHQTGEYLDYGTSKDWIGGHCESWYHIIPPAVYKDPNIPETYHPEWYSSRQLCLTNQAMLAEFIKNLKQMILDNPMGTIVNLGEEDSGGMCTCANCKQEMRDYNVSGYVIRFSNKVINEIEEWKKQEGINREFDYVIFAYSASGSHVPPVEKLADGSYKIKDESCRPHEKLYIRLAPLDPYCYYHSFETKSCSLNAVFVNYVNGWRAITNNFYIWDYAADYRDFLPFYDMYGALQDNLRWYKEIGIKNIYRQDSTAEASNSFAAFDAYLTAKLMWDVDADVDALTQDFFTKYYESGAKDMLAYFNLMRSHYKMLDATLEKGVHNTCYFRLDPNNWPIRVLEQALAYINSAAASYESLKATDPDRYEVMYLRTLRESVCVRSMILENYSAYYNINSKAYTEMIDQFEIDVGKTGVRLWEEGGSIDQFIASLRGN